mmetsp:Transcript_60006/g.178619  ORF Transcript_60006/g.178619 Transcript_60006/m.178619 type:complete len:272 (+) Transcript_60006:1-816(+)
MAIGLARSAAKLPRVISPPTACRQARGARRASRAEYLESAPMPSRWSGTATKACTGTSAGTRVGVERGCAPCAARTSIGRPSASRGRAEVLRIRRAEYLPTRKPLHIGAIRTGASGVCASWTRCSGSTSTHPAMASAADLQVTTVPPSDAGLTGTVRWLESASPLGSASAMRGPAAATAPTSASCLWTGIALDTSMRSTLRGADGPCLARTICGTYSWRRSYARMLICHVRAAVGSTDGRPRRRSRTPCPATSRGPTGGAGWFCPRCTTTP